MRGNVIILQCPVCEKKRWAFTFEWAREQIDRHIARAHVR